MTDEPIRDPVLREIAGEMQREVEAVYQAAAQQVAARAKAKMRQLVDALLERHEEIVLRDLPIQEAQRLITERRAALAEFYRARCDEIDALVVTGGQPVLPASTAVH